MAIPTQHAEKLAGALAGGDSQAAVAATEEALAAGVEPLALIQEVVVPTLVEGDFIF